MSPGDQTPFPNVRHAPDPARGMSFNLANNIWGTNYVMWQPYAPEATTLRFRFRIAAGPAEDATLSGRSWWPSSTTDLKGWQTQHPVAVS